MIATPFMGMTRDAAGIRSITFRALGTQCQIKLREDQERVALEFAAEALDWINRFEEKFSRFKPSSLVSTINANAGDWVEIDDEAEGIFDIADELFAATGGILDPSTLPLLEVWNWKVVHASLPSQNAIDEALALTGWTKVERRPGGIRLPEAGMGIDLGGFGKELAVDAVIAIAKRHGIEHALVDLGRDIYAMGTNGAQPFWHVGVEDGNNPGTCWAGLGVSDVAVSASGDYARFFTHEGRRFGHILDPRSGWPVNNGTRAVNVIARSCLEAGALSTAIFVLGAKDGLRLAHRNPSVSVCVQSVDGIDGSQNFGKWLVRPA